MASTKDEVELDEADRAAIAEVSKGYYHNRPKNEACASPARIDAAADTLPEKRSEVDSFQKKWDKFDRDDVVDAAAKEAEASASTVKSGNSSGGSAGDKKSTSKPKKEETPEQKEQREKLQFLIDFYRGNPQQLLNDTLNMKDEGFRSYKAGEYEKAVQSWELASGCISKFFDPECFKDIPISDSVTDEAKKIDIALYSNLAMAHLNLENFDQTLDNCQKVLEREPKNEKALYRRGCALMMTDEFVEARKSVAELLEIKPDHSGALMLADDITRAEEDYKYKDQFEEAEDQFEKGEFREARKSLTKLLAQEPKHARAQKLLKEAEDKERAAIKASKNLAAKMCGQDKPTPTAAQQDKQAKIKTMIEEASSHLKANRFQDARSLLQAALKLDASHKGAQLKLMDVASKEKVCAAEQTTESKDNATAPPAEQLAPSTAEPRRPDEGERDLMKELDQKHSWWRCSMCSKRKLS